MVSGILGSSLSRIASVPGRGVLPGRISVEHQQSRDRNARSGDPPAVRKRRSHKGDDRRIARLVDFEGIEEALDDDDATMVGSLCAMQVEEHFGFPEACREAIFRLLVINGATDVGD